MDITKIIIALCFLSCSVVHADSFEKLIMPGPVIQGHAKYEQECDKCHQLMSKEEQNRLCLDCHDLIDKDMKTGKGYHGKAKGMKQAPCKSCHIEHKGRDADIVKLDDRLFPHHMTDFSLEGAHKTVNCNRCHQPDKKHREAQSECYLCHKDNPHDGKLGNRCSQCHSQVSWNVMDFDHDKTKFKLTGRHQDTACNSCHINNQYKDTPKTCFSCHSVDDVHHGKNGRECAKCHNTNGWKKLSFNHDKDTKFKLLGRHKSVSCASCHPKDPYKFKIEDSCVSCHKADDRHRGQYGKDCQSCHGFDRWDRIVFNHDRDTRYRLQGKHKEAKCVACHKANIKDKVSTKCIDCHKFDDAHGGKINQKCDTCHSAESWHTSIVFDHDLSGFPLIGLHTIAACDDCHLTRHYKDTSRACNACHNKDDVHKLRLGPQCGDCHNPNAWGVWRFDHDRETRFRLDGAHKKIHCYDCHQEPAKNGIKLGQSCGYCHGRDDPHNNQFGQMCEQCHDTRSFRNVNMLR